MDPGWRCKRLVKIILMANTVEHRVNSSPNPLVSCGKSVWIIVGISGLSLVVIGFELGKNSLKLGVDRLGLVR